MTNPAPPDKRHPLIAGYCRWRKRRWPAEAPVRQRLACEGQRPGAVVVACADSRADPAALFDTGPGEIFVLRNVAALVPPPEADGFHHGTSAGLEFAITRLGVPHLLVLGHTGCGGVSVALDRLDECNRSDFIGPWVALLAEARTRIAARGSLSRPERQRALEEEAVRLSVARARAFPFVQEAEAAGRLTVDGALFDIASGLLYWLDPHTGRFAPIEREADSPALSR
ncbi:MAG: carbonic anhydrase [Alphaproteobacteria bacterium]|nr:MAG: carbonic anhydrase [Alphaproteobacteria bacterium]